MKKIYLEIYRLENPIRLHCSTVGTFPSCVRIDYSCLYHPLINNQIRFFNFFDCTVFHVNGGISEKGSVEKILKNTTLFIIFLSSKMKNILPHGIRNSSQWICYSSYQWNDITAAERKLWMQWWTPIAWLLLCWYWRIAKIPHLNSCFMLLLEKWTETNRMMAMQSYLTSSQINFDHYFDMNDSMRCSQSCSPKFCTQT